MLSARVLIIVFGVILAGVFLLIPAGCSRAAGHKVLTFFFEGVPPPDGKARESWTRIISINRNAPGRPGPIVPSDPEQARRLAQKRGSRHKPTGDCNKCHTAGMSVGKRQLSKPIPELCYSCHTDHRDAAGYLHGPITSAGICLFCHDPHQSGYVHLQRAPQPDLCYRCHLREDMGAIVGHAERVDTICTNCHEPHVSSRDKLLKPYEEMQGDPNTLSSMYKLLNPDVELEGDPNTVSLIK